MDTLGRVLAGLAGAGVFIYGMAALEDCLGGKLFKMVSGSVAVAGGVFLVVCALTGWRP